jgi:hypothetical protein
MRPEFQEETRMALVSHRSGDSEPLQGWLDQLRFGEGFRYGDVRALFADSDARYEDVREFESLMCELEEESR